MLVPGSAEFLNMRVSQLDEHPVYAKFFEQASKGPLSKATPMVPPGGAGIGMHVIPVEKAIDAASTSVPIEHIEHWLDKYEGKYAASTCSCRASRRVMGGAVPTTRPIGASPWAIWPTTWSRPIVAIT